jgi:sugar lactone lactonase YvrE
MADSITVNDMSTMARPGTTEQNLLGEGARWDARRDELLRVDIVAGRVFRDRVTEDGSLELIRAYTLDGTVGAIVPIEGDEGWLLAANRGFAHLTPNGAVHPIAEIVPDDSRMNDAVCDPQGRFWAGSLAHDHRDGAGSLWRLDPDGSITHIRDGLTIPNGIGWSLDRRTMYFIDSGPRLIRAFDFDAATGAISNERVLVAVDASVGSPDGLTIDTGGDLWVAVYDGGRVQRYSPDGILKEEHRVPAAQTTSCAFAGPGLHRLYVTTATEDWSDDQRLAEPTAGVVYHLDTDATGRPADPFRPDPAWWGGVRAPNTD